MPIWGSTTDFASQRAGRVNVQGSFFTEIDCDGSAAWTADLVSFNGRFVGGHVNVDAFAFGFDRAQSVEHSAAVLMAAQIPASAVEED